MVARNVMPVGYVDRPGRRIDAIDFAKGVLVLLMVVYHALNYLHYGSIPHDYLAFLPSSFIMITGFLVSQVYSGRQDVDLDKAASRLGVRALKLIVLFTALNVVARLIWSTNSYGTEISVPAFFRGWVDVYVTGDAAGVAFEVLVPISYTLLLSIGLLRIQAATPSGPRVIAVAGFFLCVLLDYLEISINTLNFVSAGVIGIGLGSLQLKSVDRWARSWQFQSCLMAAYAAVLLLGLDNYTAQILVTFVCIAVLYAIGSLLSPNRWWFEQVSLLGRYSLVSYIAQILYLQGTNRLVAMAPEFPFGKVSLLMLVIALSTWLTVTGVAFARRKIGAADWIYRSLFA